MCHMIHVKWTRFQHTSICGKRDVIGIGELVVLGYGSNNLEDFAASIFMVVAITIFERFVFHLFAV